MNDTYTGVWTQRDDNGCVIKSEGITFDREFRGHRFTDEECQALLQGYYIDVIGIESRGVRYNVRGKLVETVRKTEKCTYKTVRFKAIDTPIVNDFPEVENDEDESDYVNESITDEYSLEKMMQELEEDNAEWDAMLDAPECVEVKKVSKKNEPVKYVPVLGKFDE